MSDSFRVPRRRPGRGARRWWATAALAVAVASALSVQAGAASASTTSSSSYSSVPASVAQSARGAGTPRQGSPAYYDSGLDSTPHMGSDTYYSLGGAVTESSAESVCPSTAGPTP